MNGLLFLIILLPFSLSGEEPPPPEYPYPKGFRKDRKKTSEIEKPVKIDKGGVYYYSKKRKKKKPQIHDGIEKPYKVGSDGAYYYSTKNKKKKKHLSGGVEKPKTKKSNGDFFYYDENTFKFNGILSIFGGYYRIPKVPFAFNRPYRDIYSKDHRLPFWPFIFRMSYEQNLVDSLFLKLSSGISSFKGRLNGDETTENSRLYFFPTTLSLSYKLSFLDVQYLTPYVDVGMGYLVESRKEKVGHDMERKYHKHQVASLGLGVLISFSKFQNEKSPLNDYGITQSWFDIQYRKIFDLKNCHDSGCKNFTSDIVTAGFAFGFGGGKKKRKRKSSAKTYVSKDETFDTTQTFSLLGGVYGPPDIQPAREGGRDYQDMYSDKKQFVFRFEYGRRLFKYNQKLFKSDQNLFHSFFIKFDSGFTQASGEGEFVGVNQGVKPREKFRFFIFPTTVSLSYKLDFLPYLSPYVDGGMGYFGFLETRSDQKKPHYGGAFVSSISFGVLISLLKFQNQLTVFNEYGISQSWLNLQYRQIVGMNERKDFTSDMITGGFTFGF